MAADRLGISHWTLRERLQASGRGPVEIGLGMVASVVNRGVRYGRGLRWIVTQSPATGGDLPKGKKALQLLVRRLQQHVAVLEGRNGRAVNQKAEGSIVVSKPAPVVVAERTLSEIEEGVAAAIRTRPGVFRRQLDLLLGLTRDQCRAAIDRLRKKKRIRMQRAGSLTRYYSES